MTTGYQRQSVASIVNGLVINASDFNNEFNALLAAFDVTNGHDHDGTTGGGAKVPNAGLVNNSITFGTTSVALGTNPTSLNSLTFTNATLGNGTALSADMSITGFTLQGGGTGVINSAVFNNCGTSGTLTLFGPVTASGQTITGGTFAGATTSGTLTLGGPVTATSSTITGGTFNGPTISTATLNNAILGSGTGTGAILGAALNITGQAIVGSGTGTISGCILSGNNVAATAAIGDNDTSVADTAFVQNEFSGTGQQSLNTNGFQNIASTGAKIQWGTGTTDSSGISNITFADPFPNNCFIIVPFVQNSSPNPNQSFYNTVTRTGFRMHINSGAIGIVSVFTYWAVGN